MGEYRLGCPVCGKTFKPKFEYKCADHNGLIFPIYEKEVLEPQNKLPGLWRYLDWLPVNEPSETTSGPVTYKSEHLAKELGLRNLWISFNGYWPKKKARVLSGTFKEYEAIVTLQRMKEYGIKKIVLASAGNTARAFAHISRYYNIKVIAVVPEANLDNIWLPQGRNPHLKLISVKNGDYLDAIELAQRIVQITKFTYEGGAKNIARRAGMGSVVLDAAFTMKDLPQNYFQGIGSGTGGISAYEAAFRLTGSGNFENKKMRLHLAQNMPFTPIHNAYVRKSRTINKRTDMPSATNAVKEVAATMLTNRNPPYSTPGGVYDVLGASDGVTYGVTNDMVGKAQDMFKDFEDRTIVPEAGAALASLMLAMNTEALNTKETVLLNITGGGVRGVFRDIGVFYPKPSVEVEPGVSTKELRGLFE